MSPEQYQSLPPPPGRILPIPPRETRPTVTPGPSSTHSPQTHDSVCRQAAGLNWSISQLFRKHTVTAHRSSGVGTWGSRFAKRASTTDLLPKSFFTFNLFKICFIL